VASAVRGVSGRARIQALLEGEKDSAQIADLARRSSRGKIPELQKALAGYRTEHHRFLLRLLWKQLTQQEALIAELEAKIQKLTRCFAPQMERLDGVPGVDRRVAEVVLAELASDMNPFPTHRHLSAWAGMCPGHEESAGKRRKRRSHQAIAG
jgi:transposase